MVRGPHPAPGEADRSLGARAWTARVAVAAGLGLALGAGCVPPPGDLPAEPPVVDAARFEAGEEAPPPDAGAVLDASGDGAPDSVPASTVLHVRVHDSQTGKALPAKLFLRDAETDRQLHFGNHEEAPQCMAMAGSLREVGTGGALATWNGLALWNGEARVPIGTDWEVATNGCATTLHRDGIPFGRYVIIAARGLEYELTTAIVELGAGRGEVSIDLPLNRSVDTRGYLAADMHIHSGSPEGTSGQGSWDSLISPENRVKTEAVAGIEVMVSSDHNYLTDLSVPIAHLWPGGAPPLAAIVGNEASANFGHFNAMPVAVDASRADTNGALSPGEIQLLSPHQLFDHLHRLPTTPLIQLNHPRLNFAAYFNDATACDWRDLGHLPPCSLDFEAIEVLNGWLACGAKVHETLDDWYALMRFGLPLAATGNSDTHGSSNIEAGFPRTYVRVADDTVAAFDEREFIGAVRGRRAVATTGPFLTLRVGSEAEGGMVAATAGGVSVSLRLQAASWVKVDVVRLLVDGHVVRTWRVPLIDGVPTSVLELNDVRVDVAADAAITAEAEGETPLPAWMVGDFLLDPVLVHLCSDPARPGMIPFAVTNPVLVDADGDGVFRASMQATRAAAVHDRWVPPRPGPNDCNPLAPAYIK